MKFHSGGPVGARATMAPFRTGHGRDAIWMDRDRTRITDGARLAVEHSTGGEIEQQARSKLLDDVPDADTVLHRVVHPHRRNPSGNLPRNLLTIAHQREAAFRVVLVSQRSNSQPPPGMSNYSSLQRSREAIAGAWAGVAKGPMAVAGRFTRGEFSLPLWKTTSAACVLRARTNALI